MESAQFKSNTQTNQNNTHRIKLNQMNTSRNKSSLLSPLLSPLCCLFADVPTSDAPVVEGKPCLGSHTHVILDQRSTSNMDDVSHLVVRQFLFQESYCMLWCSSCCSSSCIHPQPVTGVPWPRSPGPGPGPGCQGPGPGS